MEFDLSLSHPLALFSFFAVLLSYNLQRWVRWDEGPAHLSRSVYAGLVSIGGVGSFLMFFFLDASILLFLLPLALISLLYALPLPGGYRGLRDLPFLKLFLIAFSWTYLSVSLPHWLGERDFSIPEWALFTERLFFFLAITIPFDIRDLPYDALRKRTLPQMLGVRGAKGVALAFLVLFWGVMSWRTLCSEGIALLSFSAFTLNALVSSVLIGRCGPEKEERFYSGLLDGTIHLQFLLLFLFRSLG